MKFVAPAISLLYLAAILFGFWSYFEDPDLDAFMPAFSLTPFGLLALAAWLAMALKKPRRWFLAVPLGAILAAILGFLVYLLLMK